MSKIRVYELAKELGVESKVIVAKLQDMGEFVRSASWCRAQPADLPRAYRPSRRGRPTDCSQRRAMGGDDGEDAGRWPS